MVLSLEIKFMYLPLSGATVKNLFFSATEIFSSVAEFSRSSCREGAFETAMTSMQPHYLSHVNTRVI